MHIMMTKERRNDIIPKAIAASHHSAASWYGILASTMKRAPQIIDE